MSDEEDDYLSDKFLLAASAPEKPQTYSQRRKEAEKHCETAEVLITGWTDADPAKNN